MLVLEVDTMLNNCPMHNKCNWESSPKDPLQSVAFRPTPWVLTIIIAFDGSFPFVCGWRGCVWNCDINVYYGLITNATQYVANIAPTHWRTLETH